MGSPSWSLRRHIHQKAHPCSCIKTGFSAHLQTSRRGIHISPIHKNIILMSFSWSFIVSFFFLDIHVVRDNDVWGQLGHSGGGEITPTKCLFHLLGLLDQIGTGTRRGKAGADRSLCRNEPARLKESCPWNLLLQHKAECWNKGNLRLYCRQKEYANRNCRTHSILSLGNTCFFVFCFSFSTQ